MNKVEKNWQKIWEKVKEKDIEKKYQKVPKSSKSTHKYTKVHKSTQKYSKLPRSTQKFPKSTQKYQTLPEAQPTQGIESVTWVIFFSQNSFKLISVRKMIQVIDSIPWVRCASGNVLVLLRNFGELLGASG